LTVRHDDFTVQVPTLSPPQADTFWQLPPAELPPVAPVPPLPPCPEPVPGLELQAAEAIPAASVTSNRRDGMVIRILRQLLREARLIAGKIRAIIG
jgi:hypothetical protein